MDFIQGEKFMSLANGTTIFYYHTHEVLPFLKNVPVNRFILITHNSDHKIDDSFILPANMIRWFAQNVDVVNERIESLPIGLENNKWFKEDKKKEKMVHLLQRPKQHRNLVYMNHNVATNIEKRKRPYEVLEGKHWVTIEKGANGHDFAEFIADVYNHKFVICPEGNGIDTVRTWETLYMKSIPIEKRNINNQFYTDLPICFVDDWAEITEDFLNQEYERINSCIWKLDKLNFSYWKDKILSYDK
jgi:hypothetical protein